jgi:hypothetical protein
MNKSANRFAIIVCVAVLGSGSAFAKDVKVKSWCPMTHAKGVGTGATFDIAKDRAIKSCLANGGMMMCCPNYVRQM